MIPIRHFIVVFAVSIFFIVYIWQNIEVMKIKLGFKKLADSEKRIMLERNRYINEIEQFRRMDAIEKQAGERKLKKIARDDYIVLKGDENIDNQKQ